MKPLNLHKLTRGQIVKLDGQNFRYLTCDTRTATFRRESDGQLIEFELSIHNDVMGWNGCTFTGVPGGGYSAKRRAGHAPTPEEYGGNDLSQLRSTAWR